MTKLSAPRGLEVLGESCMFTISYYHNSCWLRNNAFLGRKLILSSHSIVKWFPLSIEHLSVIFARCCSYRHLHGVGYNCCPISMHHSDVFVFSQEATLRTWVDFFLVLFLLKLSLCRSHKVRHSSGAGYIHATSLWISEVTFLSLS